MEEALTDESGLDGRSLYAIQKRLRTREVLLKSARRQLSEGKALVIADLAKEAGVSVATVYNHFDGPEAILKAITEDVVNRSIADASSLVRSNGPQAATELFPTLLYESFAYLNEAADPSDSPAVFLADQQIIEKIYETVSSLLAKNKLVGEDKVRNQSKLVTYMILGALFRAGKDLTSGDVAVALGTESESAVDLLRSILRAVSKDD
jgi:AcrR family transcriptional regulator